MVGGDQPDGFTTTTPPQRQREISPAPAGVALCSPVRTIPRAGRRDQLVAELINVHPPCTTASQGLKQSPRDTEVAPTSPAPPRPHHKLLSR